MIEPRIFLADQRRFFLAHSKRDNAIEERIAQARTAMDTFAQGKPYTVVAGRDFFNERFKEAGSWPAWTSLVATGVDFATRAPLFHAILVPHGAVGAGTAEIIRKSIEAGKPVLAFGRIAAADFCIYKVTGVVHEVADDWAAGYRLTF